MSDEDPPERDDGGTPAGGADEPAGDGAADADRDGSDGEGDDAPDAGPPADDAHEGNGDAAGDRDEAAAETGDGDTVGTDADDAGRQHADAGEGEQDPAAGADGDPPEGDPGPSPPPGEPDPASAAEVEQLRAELREFRADVDQRTLHRDEVEADLRRYVRLEMARGHARGWGPYLVLLYGTIMTLGAFYYLEGFAAVAAMVVIWLSTLGLFVVFVAVGAGLSLTRIPRRIYRRVRERR